MFRRRILPGLLLILTIASACLGDGLTCQAEYSASPKYSTESFVQTSMDGKATVATMSAKKSTAAKKTKSSKKSASKKKTSSKKKSTAKKKSSSSTSTTTVYITKTGTKYHRGDCSYLSKSKISISLSDAKADGYTACSRCNPPS